MITVFTINLDSIGPTLLMTTMVSVIVLHLYFMYLVAASKTLSFGQELFWTALILVLPLLGCLAYWFFEMRSKEREA
jgi:hypothetical protein